MEYNFGSFDEMFQYWHNRCLKYEYRLWDESMIGYDNECTLPCSNLLNFKYIYYEDKRQAMIKYLMTNSLGETALGQIGFMAKEKQQVIYDLCWYLIMTSGSADNIELFDGRRVTFLTYCNTDTLIKILGNKYIERLYDVGISGDLRDRAVLIYSILTGIFIKSYRKVDKTVYNIRSNIVWWVINGIFINIVEPPYSYMNESNIAPPYSYINEYNVKILLLVKDINYENIGTYMFRYGMMSGGKIKNPIKFFIRELWEMEVFQRRRWNIITEKFFLQRGVDVNKLVYNHETNEYNIDIGNIPTYDEVKFFGDKTIFEILNIYSTIEIYEAYEPVGLWNNKDSLIYLIQDNMKRRLFRIKGNFCRNGERMNLTTLRPHYEDMGMESDPIISYGYPGKYRCYQMSELEQTFRVYEDDGMFHFGVPDYIPNTIDEITGEKAEKYFSIESIKQLAELIEPFNNFRSLSKIIEKGLDNNTSGRKEILRLVKILDKGTNSQKYVVHLYLVWLFLFGMWLRNWKGPGNEWPFNGQDFQDLDVKCDDNTRDNNFHIQMLVHDAILRLARNFSVDEFITYDLRILSYNFMTGDVAMIERGKSVLSTIEQVINAMRQGIFCLAHGSDIVLQSSYYLIMQFMELKNNDDFNKMLKRITPMINETEKRIVDELGRTLNGEDKLYETAIERKSILKNPVIRNKPFIIDKMMGTAHIDPEFGRQIVYDA